MADTTAEYPDHHTRGDEGWRRFFSWFGITPAQTDDADNSE